jgi:hypothetical protein
MLQRIIDVYLDSPVLTLKEKKAAAYVKDGLKDLAATSGA